MYFDTSPLIYNTRERMPLLENRPSSTKLDDIQQRFPNLYSVHLFTESLLLFNETFSRIKVSQWARSKTVLSSLIKLYRMYQMCARDLKSTLTREFDHVLRVREDSFFFFETIDLAKIAQRHDCDVIHNNCQVWGGLNNRWQLIRSNESSAYFASHMNFVNRIRVFRAEEYEKRVTDLLRLKTCMESPRTVGHAITRALNDTHVCMRKNEINCLPCKARVLSCAEGGVYSAQALKSMCPK